MATYNKHLGDKTVDHTAGAHLVVKLVRSGIGAKPKSRGTLRALGLKKIGDTNTLPDRPEIRGMIARVPHLLSVDTRTGKEGTGS
jgi:large subunit ribosomal protein L30